MYSSTEFWVCHFFNKLLFQMEIIINHSMQFRVRIFLCVKPILKLLTTDLYTKSTRRHFHVPAPNKCYVETHQLARTHMTFQQASQNRNQQDVRVTQKKRHPLELENEKIFDDNNKVGYTGIFIRYKLYFYMFTLSDLRMDSNLDI